MPSTVLQIQIPACVDGVELSGYLSCPEFLGLWEEVSTLTIYWQGDKQGLLDAMTGALSQLGMNIPLTHYDPQPVAFQDWNAQWASSVRPVRIGRRIGIRPSWATIDMPENGIEIVLDPKQAFGTGHHATTHLLLEWLEEIQEVKQGRVLDVGTGSGILSMVALRLGAVSALGIDCDPVAIDCANDYGVINGFSDLLELRCCCLEDVPNQPFAVILANIDRKTILSLLGELSRFQGPGTQLLLSGLLEEDEKEVVDRVQELDWGLRAVRKREGWLALHFDVRSSV